MEVLEGWAGSDSSPLLCASFVNPSSEKSPGEGEGAHVLLTGEGTEVTFIGLL